MGYNFRDIKGGATFSPLPEDRYIVAIDKAELTTTREAGHPMIKLTLKVVEGEFKGRYVWDNLVLVPNSLWKTKGVLEAAGSDLASAESATEEQIIKALNGKKVSVYVEQRVGDNGNISNSVRYYNAVSEAPARKSSASLMN